MNSEPSTRHMYLFGTEDTSENNPVLYNLHIVEGYDLAGAIRTYSELYNLDDAYEKPVLIREVEQWRGEGPLGGFGVRPRPDRTKPEDESDEEDMMKESIVKGERTKEKKPIDIIEYEPQFDIACGDITPNFPYILEIDNIDTGISERHIVVITKILSNCIYCNQWDNINDNPHSGIVLTASEFRERNAALYKISGEDLK